MRVLIDASTLLNLSNGGVLELAMTLEGVEFFVSVEVRKESKTIEGQIVALHQAGLLEYIDENCILAQDLERGMTTWDLGAGECECILAASTDDSIVACDDMRARNRIQDELGANRMTGSIGILRQMVEQELILPAEAFDAYQRMRGAGGFLPDLSRQYFQIPA